MAVEAMPDNQAEPRLSPFWLILLATLIGSAALFTGNEESLRAAVIGAVLAFALFVIFRKASLGDRNPTLLFEILVIAWLLKIGAVALRLHLILGVYGTGDALSYHGVGQEIAAGLEAGILPISSRFWGTQFIEMVTGVLYSITGPTMIGAFLIFACLSLLGLLLHYKAFVTAFPEGDHALFRLLIFLYPSLLFWTSSLGKDALIMLPSGMVAYGVAKTSRYGLGLASTLWIGVGLSFILLIRPHLAAIVAVGLVAVVLLQPSRLGRLSPLVRLAGLIVFGILAVLVVRTSASFIHLDDLSVEGVVEFAAEAQQEGGGSTFAGGGLPRSPQAILAAPFNVLFRPFPWESRGIFGLASAAEGVVLAGLLFWRRRSVLHAIASARRHSYLAFVLIFVTIFVYFFSTINNFGILARQRAQVLPFVMVWLACCAAASRPSTEYTQESADTQT